MPTRRSPTPRAASPGPSTTATSTLAFDLAEGVPVRLVVYDVLGREVAVLVDAEVAAGRHEVRFEAGSLPAGTYLVRLQAGGAVRSHRITHGR